MSRVQIKETSASKGGNSWFVNTVRKNGIPYGDSIDALAVYVKPEDKWLIIPSEDISQVGLQFSMKGKYAKYINNWRMFYEAKQEGGNKDLPMHGSPHCMRQPGHGSEEAFQEV